MIVVDFIHEHTILARSRYVISRLVAGRMATFVCCLGSQPTATDTRSDVLLLTLDTTRTDRLGITIIEKPKLHPWTFSASPVFALAATTIQHR